MARLREFDTDVALDAAMQAFWLGGYEATSMADLMAAMGLNKGSIYKAFNDKHSLFMLALRQYLDQSNAFSRQCLEDAVSPKAGVADLLHTIVAQRGNDQARRGCFMLNSLVELAPHDEAVRTLLEAHLSHKQTMLAGAIAKGQSLGEFRADIPAADLSLMVLNLLQSLVIRSKGGVAVAALQQQVDILLKLLA
ncbi:helix-turn-helix transcriptional regulator [filamentous cyanobacterium LEGE 11480]|uniref:Helix-turn-helix transcriptional regulator n=1 Tax=Romeriopsis navalis LEGE 11480 TaxID=2777977 RepID=A0A928Z3Z4_9CYAN|nr:TetR/AcrR family transcriptional regulator [Romeriopsis navalis]MBE9030512.1 helix-turn-helix transcriptional regulator [Romeriopsis navalis LEGE 11480]